MAAGRSNPIQINYLRRLASNSGDQVCPISLAFAFAGAGRHVEAAGAVAHADAGTAAFAGAVFAVGANYYEINS